MREHIGPIERHPARPELIEARARELQRLAEQAMWQELVTGRAFAPATAHWEGLVAPELVNAPVPLKRAVAASCEALMWAALALRLWAQRVREFNHTVADLESRWPQPAGWRLRIGPILLPFNPDDLLHQVLLRQARADLQQQWREAYHRLIDQGEDEAIAMLRQGPTVAGVRRAQAAGLLPAHGSWGFFGARWRALVAPEHAAELAAYLAATSRPDLAAVEQFADLLAQHANDPAFARFLGELNPAQFYQLLGNLAGMSDLSGLDSAERQRWQAALAAVQQGLGVALGTASIGIDGTPPALSDQWLADLIAHGRGLVEVPTRAGQDVPVEVYGYQLLGPLLHHGHYDAQFLAAVGGDMIDFEREQGGSEFWMRHHGLFYHEPAPFQPGSPPDDRVAAHRALTNLRLDWVHGWDNGPQGFDPVVGLASAMERHPDAARALLTGLVTEDVPDYAAPPPGGQRLPRLDYLLTDRQWPVDVVGPPADAHWLRSSTSGYTSPGLETLGRAMVNAVTVNPDDRSHLIFEALVYEVANDEQRWGYPNDPTGQGRQLGNRAATFDQVEIVHPALRPALGAITAHHIDDVHWNLVGQPTPADLPGGERIIDLESPDLQILLAELGKDAQARQSVLVAQAVYNGLLYDHYLGGEAGQLSMGERLDAAYAATTIPAAQVTAALDFGATGEIINRTVEHDTAHNDAVQLPYLLAELVTEAATKQLPLSTAIGLALEQSMADHLADHTGVANQEIGQLRQVSRELLAQQLEEAIYRHTPREQLHELGLLYPQDHPLAGEPIPRSQWSPDGPESMAWSRYVTGPAAHEALLALQRSQLDYDAAYAGARDNLAHIVGMPG